MTKKFQRTIEWFICKKCGAEVHGNGYTNHCTQCFTSLHVDVEPGDRRSTCGGLMLVKNIELEHGVWFLLHQCEQCGFERRNRLQDDDNMDNFIALREQLTRTATRG